MSKNSPSLAMSDDADWRADDDMRTLVQAAEIRKDPKRLKAALARAKKKADELAALKK